MADRATAAHAQDEALELARQLIARRSITPDDGGCLDVIGSRLLAAGFRCERLDRHGVSNLWAQHGVGGPLVCLAGHVDVVSPGPLDQWTSDPFAPTERDGHLFGRGAADMKGPLAALLTAAERVAAIPDHRGRIAVLLTSDEEGEAIHGTAAVVEILKARGVSALSHHPSFDVPLPVLAYIAKTVTHNGRDLEGALNRLLAHNKLTGQSVTLEMAEREVRDLIRPQEPKRVKIEDIQRIVARQYNVSRSDLLSSRRTANVVRPRQVAMYLAKTLTLRSLPEIGRRFGGRDHTTVLHAVRKIEGLVGNDMALAEEIEILKRQLQE